MFPDFRRFSGTVGLRKSIPLLEAITDPDDREQVRQIIEDVRKYGYQS